MENFLITKELGDCITTPVKEKKPEILAKAKGFLALSVDTQIQSHIQALDTPKLIWDHLKKLFEDSGLSRRIALLRQLTSLRLESCEGMQDYINSLTDLCNKLKGINFEISEPWKVSILLAGLTDEFRPFILGIEARQEEVTSEFLIQKLIDNSSDRSESGSAFSSKKKFQHKSVKKCFNCGEPGHFANDCVKSKKKEKDSKGFKNKKETQNPKSGGKGAFLAVAKKSDDEHTSLKCGSQVSNSCLNKQVWYIDSGASSHMSPHREIFADYKEMNNGSITAANNEKMPIKAVGNTKIKLCDNEVTVSDVLHVPKLGANLLSVAQIVNMGNSVVFDVNGCSIYNKEEELITSTPQQNGVYKLSDVENKVLVAMQPDTDAMLWHRRLGHVNYQTLIKMKNGAVDGMNFKDNEDEIKNCVTCAESKMCAKPFEKSKRETTEILQLLHSDVNGPMETQSIGKAKYFVTFIDDFSRKVFVFFLRSKSEVTEKYVEFVRFIENQTGKKVKTLRSDNGGEYINERFLNFCKQKGIHHEKTIPHTPQQNGVAERMNRTLIEKAKSLLFDADLPKCFWAEAVHHAAYLTNRCLTSSTGKVPEEVFSGKKVNIAGLKLFGCDVMVLLPKENRKKLDKNSEKLMFIGYDDSVKGYRCINRKTKKFRISRSLKFLECGENPSTVDFDIEIQEENPVNVEPENLEMSDEENPGTDPNIILDSSSEYDDTRNDPSYSPSSTGSSESPEITLRPATRSQRNGTPSFLGLALLCEPDYAYKCDDEKHHEDPMIVKDLESRNDSQEWKQSMISEYDSLIENDTWKLVKLPENRMVIKTKWIFKTKRDTNGNIVKRKSRLVAKGYTQRYGIDYEETYAPVVRYTSIRFLMALAVKNRLMIHQMDAVTAFLQGDVNEEIYIEQPEGFDDQTGRVCQLKKAIYGLKQSGRMWNLKLDQTLKNNGLKASKLDPCVYFSGNKELIVAIYVDDFLIFYKDRKCLENLQNILTNTFKMKDIGDAKGCIGIRINRNDEKIELDQQIYVEEILKRFGMTDCKPVKNPACTSIHLTKEMDGDDESDKDVPYQEAVGSLLFLSQGTRPDIAQAVNEVSRYNSYHTKSHWAAVKRIFRYLRGTSGTKLTYTASSSGDFVGYSDSDWGGDRDSRKSTQGYVFKMANGAISWKSSKQNTIALSSTEAEYMALCTAVKEGLWLRQLAGELFQEGNDMNKSLIIFCDNQSAIKLSLSEGYRPRTKHIDLKYHFIREKIKNGDIDVQFIGTNFNTADALTKGVSADKLKFCSIQSGLIFE
jgi:hypothetical protein